MGRVSCSVQNTCARDHRAQAGFTALYVSAQNGHLEVARLLLESKADSHAAAQVPQAAQAMRTKPAELLRRGWLCLALPVRALSVRALRAERR